jgi:GAF domain-containing protein
MNEISLKNQIVQLIEQESQVGQALQKLTELLVQQVDRIQWAGFYFMDTRQQQLHLGPYTGPATEHTVIPYGKGICGQVATSGQPLRVDDVSAQDNYIACSLSTQSEIVVPLYQQEQLIGQIDLDSDHPQAFSAADEQFLTDLLAILAVQYGADLQQLQQEVTGA